MHDNFMKVYRAEGAESARGIINGLSAMLEHIQKIGGPKERRHALWLLHRLDNAADAIALEEGEVKAWEAASTTKVIVLVTYDDGARVQTNLWAETGDRPAKLLWNNMPELIVEKYGHLSCLCYENKSRMRKELDVAQEDHLWIQTL